MQEKITSDKFFEVTVAYDSTDERGNAKRATTTYAVAADTFSEAEDAAIGQFSKDTQCPEAIRMAIAPYREVILSEDEDDRFYRVAASETIIDDKTDHETTRRYSVLVQDLDLEHARAAFESRDSRDADLVSITATKISNVF